jgi:hypothetical protein
MVPSLQVKAGLPSSCLRTHPSRPLDVAKSIVETASTSRSESFCRPAAMVCTCACVHKMCRIEADTVAFRARARVHVCDGRERTETW